MTTPNIVLVQSQRLDDTPAGGGQMTATIIPDNQANNLFGPISRVNRADGNVSLRKAILWALPATTQTFFGAHLIVAQPPSNEDVSALAFYTGSWTDTRRDAVDKIESYLVRGPQTRMWAYGQQVQGQRALLVYQPVGVPLPSIGDTFVLVQQNVTPNVEQYVRITTLKSSVQTFTDTVGNFQLNVITLGIGSKLLSTFPGAEPQRYSTPAPPTILCTTNVANAATYYGVTTPSADISSGDESAVLTSVFGQLLPSTLGEAPITNASPPGVSALIPSASAAVTVGAWPVFTSAIGTKYTWRSLAPGTVKIRTLGGVQAVDDGAGGLHVGTLVSGASCGKVDYAAGALFITSNVTSGADATIEAVPATQVTQSGYSKQQPITEGARGYVYVDVLNPLPSPGTLVASYRANGRWYDLTDDGTGTLIGADGTGSGSILFDSGNAVLTLGALPDVGSNVVFAWGEPAQYDVRTGDVNIQVPGVNFTLSNPAKPSSVTITWVVGITTKTATDNGSGSLTGDGTGTIAYGSGIITLYPTSLPNPNTGYSVAYQDNPQSVQHLTPSKSGSDLVFTLTGAPISPKSVLIKYGLTAPSTYPHLFGGNPLIAREIHDDGAGGLVDTVYGAIAGSSVDYTTGDVSFNPDLVTGVSTPVYDNVTQQVWSNGSFSGSPPPPTTVTLRQIVGWSQSTVTAGFVNGSAVNVWSTAASASHATQSDNFPAPPIILDLTPKTVEPIVPGSVMFTFAGYTYIDRAGSLYRSVSSLTNSGTSAGSIDYTHGTATITDWNAGGAQTLSIGALLCEQGVNPVAFLAARVPGQSVRPASFIIQANRKSDNTLITATADANGDFSTSDMTGKIITDTGFFNVAFGESVLDSSLTTDQKAEPWYNSGNVDGTGHIWKPDEALNGTIRYSCVVDTFLPLSASVLGLDPVRLPQDGRVLIIQAGNTLVFRNPLSFTFGGTVAAGDVTALPRGALESAVLYDADGFAVDIGLYTADLSAGSITMSTPCDLSDRGDGHPYAQPLVCRHTRGELVLCTDAQINGQCSWSPGLVNDYPAASSFVSSALIAENAGNLQASYDTLFEQSTWNFDANNLFDDVVHGPSPAASYDDVDYPIQVLDSDTITQRIMLHFTAFSSGVWSGDVIFEELGVRGTFRTDTNVSVLNPATGSPYFVMDHRGFGGGWAVGNAIRFNLRGAGLPVWFVRSVQVGATETLDDKFWTEARWDE